MELWEAIIGRRSVRQFSDEPIGREEIGEILDAARWAPSAGNVQDWEIVVVQDEGRKRKLAEACWEQMFIADAPVVFVVFSNLNLLSRYRERGIMMYSYQDTAAAIQNMLLVAYSLGIGSCWVGAFDDEEVSEIVGAPEHLRPVAVIPMGYPERIPEAPIRHDISDYSYVEEYGKKMEKEWKGFVEYCKGVHRRIREKLGNSILRDLEKY